MASHYLQLIFNSKIKYRDKSLCYFFFKFYFIFYRSSLKNLKKLNNVHFTAAPSIWNDVCLLFKSIVLTSNLLPLVIDPFSDPPSMLYPSFPAELLPFFVPRSATIDFGETSYLLLLKWVVGR